MADAAVGNGLQVEVRRALGALDVPVTVRAARQRRTPAGASGRRRGGGLRSRERLHLQARGPFGWVGRAEVAGVCEAGQRERRLRRADRLAERPTLHLVALRAAAPVVLAGEGEQGGLLALARPGLGDGR